MHSKVRAQLQPRRQLLDLERWITWGRTPLTRDLRAQLSVDTLSWYMVQDQVANIQAVLEPMLWSASSREVLSEADLPSFEDYIYWCVCTPASHDGLPQTAVERAELLERVTATWHAELRLVFQSAPYEFRSCVPVLSSEPDIEMSALGAAAAGKVTLVGDSARAMSPMGGSRASTAVENAVDLVQTLHDGGSLRDFEVRMAERARVKILHSFEGGKKFWKGKEWTGYRATNESD